MRTASSVSSFTFCDDFLDARRVDAAVGDQPLDRLLGDLAAVGIEAGQDDRARRVVDDQVDAGGELERADVASLAADDAALQVVARQIDDRDGGLDGVLGGAALDGFGDVLLGAVDGRLARLGVEPLEQVGGVVPRVALDLLEQQLLGFVGRQAGDALELVLLLRRRAARTSRAAAAARFSRSASASLAARQLLLERARSPPAARRARASRRASVCSSAGRLLALRRAPAARPPRASSCAFSLASSSASFLRRLGVALGVLERARGACSSARPTSRRRCACGWRPRRRTPRPADDER